MVGAITTLIMVVAVFLAYNASQGLPFVPVYRVSAVLPNAQRLGPNNEVRIGGSRVGIVESIEAIQNPRNPNRAAAKLNMKLDKTVEPLPAGTQVRVRYKSAFGLKYVELIRRPGRPVPEGGRLPIANSSVQTEFDDIANTFDEPTRVASRGSLVGFGNAFAARGASLNEAVQNLNPLFSNLKPVAEILSAPETRLDRFFPALGRTAEIVAPVAAEQAELFTNMAITFGALSADTEALKAAISEGVPTLEQGTVALREQRPFLVDFGDLSERLRPGVRALRAALPVLNEALVTGTPVLLDTPPVSAELGRVFESLERLVRQPQTLTTLLRLRTTFNQAAPAARHLAPYQTVCNYFGYWTSYIPNALSQEDETGNVFRQLIVNVPEGSVEGVPIEMSGGMATYAGVHAAGKTGIASPHGPGYFEPRALPILHAPLYAPAIDKRGRADCQSGQNGYPLGKLLIPGQDPSDPAIAVSNLPGNRGPTFAGRKRVPHHLQPVPLEVVHP
jgi:virulence factor Mce-like protein